MAYFPDLSLYAYGHVRIEGDDEDLNVGWLSREHDFPRGECPGGFLEALRICATRPVRKYRGRHLCEFCDFPEVEKELARLRAADAAGERVFPAVLDSPACFAMDLDGREVSIGNGEVRVLGPDQRWYAAPTLVAHYVGVHSYLLPAPFIAGVMTRARSIYVLRGAQRARLRALSRPEQLSRSIELLRALAAHVHANVDAHVAKIMDLLRDGSAGPVRTPELANIPDLVWSAYRASSSGSSRFPAKMILTEDRCAR